MDIVDLLYINGYPPEWCEGAYERVKEQVDNFKKNESDDYVSSTVSADDIATGDVFGVIMNDIQVTGGAQ